MTRTADLVGRALQPRPAGRLLCCHLMAKAKKRAPRRKKAAAGSIGLSVDETRAVDTKALGDLPDAVANDGGAVLGTYRDPFGGTPVLLVSLPIDQVEPTPYQR